MISILEKMYFKLYIRALIFFSPSTLFDKINNLYWYKSTLHYWINDLNLLKKSSVLEVGCATGSLTNFMFESGLEVFGIDSSVAMISAAKANYSEIDYKVGNALSLPCEDSSFNSVMAASLINIVSEKHKVMAEMYRVCKVGGVVSILVPSTNFNTQKLKTLQEDLNISGFSRAAMEAWNNMPPKMSFDDVKLLFDQVGLREVICKSYLGDMVIAVTGRKIQ